MRIEKVYLVVSSAGVVRVAKRPRIAMDEVSVQLNIKFPDGWGRRQGEIDIDLPDPPVIEKVEETTE